MMVNCKMLFLYFIADAAALLLASRSLTIGVPVGVKIGHSIPRQQLNVLKIYTEYCLLNNNISIKLYFM